MTEQAVTALEQWAVAAYDCGRIDRSDMEAILAVCAEVRRLQQEVETLRATPKQNFIDDLITGGGM